LRTIVPVPAGAEEVVVPALLRAARGAYGDAVRARLAAAGFDDLPQNGPYILGGMANRDGSAGDLVRELGISKQAASQLIDALVLRGYLERAVDPADRRRLTIALTDRGRAAAAAVRAGVEEVDEALAGRLSPAELHGLLLGLGALAEIRAQSRAGSGGPGGDDEAAARAAGG
jgi:DNA-binding MarR family transcriptional regulator